MSYASTHQGGIGCSELAKIMTDREGRSLSPFGGPWDVLSRVKGLAERKELPVHTRGRYLERAVADWYADQQEGFGYLVEPQDWNGVPFPIRGRAPLLGTPDRLFVSESDTWGLEAKTARSKHGWGDAGTDQVPVYYAVQCHGYMEITGLSRWDIAVLFPLSEEWRKYTLSASQRIADDLVRLAWEWWDRHILHDEPLPADGSDGCADAIEGMFPKPSAPLRLATVEEARLIEDCADLNQAEKAATAALTEAENRLKLAIGDAEGLRYGPNRATWKAQSRTTINQKAFRTDHPDIARRYENTRTSRVLRVTQAEE